MNTKQPEPLRLADELVAPVGTQTTYATAHQAAEELRRLHAVEQQRDELLAELLRVKEICLRECGIGIVNEVVIARAKGDSA